MTGRGEDRGLTLIELTVALLIFALVAVMGLQALTGMLRMRDRLTEIDQDTAELGLALRLMRTDLGAMIPLVFRAPGAGPASALALSDDGRVLAFSAGGQPDLPPVDGQGLHRIEWRFDAQHETLSRRIWPVLAPASAAAAQPEAVMLRGVTGFGVRSYWDETGWRAGVTDLEAPTVLAASGPDPGDGDSSLRAVINSYTGALPEAVEITVDTAQFGVISLVESLR